MADTTTDCGCDLAPRCHLLPRPSVCCGACRHDTIPDELRASIARGLADSAAGRVSDLGDFAQYAEGDE